MSYRAGQEDGAGEDKPIRTEDGKLLGALGWDDSGREEGKAPWGSMLCVNGLARARHWKQYGWAESEAERGPTLSVFGTSELCICRMGLLQWNRNGSVANMEGKQPPMADGRLRTHACRGGGGWSLQHREGLESALRAKGG